MIERSNSKDSFLSLTGEVENRWTPSNTCSLKNPNVPKIPGNGYPGSVKYKRARLAGYPHKTRGVEVAFKPPCTLVGVRV